MFVTIKNTLSGVLDLAPLKDSSGLPLVLRGNASKEIAQADVGHPVIQRVKAMGWIKIGDAAAPEVLPPPPAPPVIKTSAQPEELVVPHVPDEPPTSVDAAPAAPAEAEAPAETTSAASVEAEAAPAAPASTKSSKPSRK